MPLESYVLYLQWKLLEPTQYECRRPDLNTRSCSEEILSSKRIRLVKGKFHSRRMIVSWYDMLASCHPMVHQGCRAVELQCMPTRSNTVRNLHLNDWDTFVSAWTSPCCKVALQQPQNQRAMKTDLVQRTGRGCIVRSGLRKEWYLPREKNENMQWTLDVK